MALFASVLCGSASSIPSPPSLPYQRQQRATRSDASRERLTPSCCQPRGSRSGPAPSRRSAPPGAAHAPPPPRRSRRSPPSRCPVGCLAASRGRELRVCAAAPFSDGDGGNNRCRRRDATRCARARPPARLAGRPGRRGRRSSDDGDDDPLAHIPAATLAVRHVVALAPSRSSRPTIISAPRVFRVFWISWLAALSTTTIIESHDVCTVNCQRIA